MRQNENKYQTDLIHAIFISLVKNRIACCRTQWNKVQFDAIFIACVKIARCRN